MHSFFRIVQLLSSLSLGLFLSQPAALAGDDLWDMHGSYRQAFEGQDGAALHYQVASKLSPACKTTLSKSLKDAMGDRMTAAGMPGLKSWYGCHEKMLMAGFQTLMAHDKSSGGAYGAYLTADQKRWAAAARSTCAARMKGLTGLNRDMAWYGCGLRLQALRFGTLNIWYYQMDHANPEGIYPTEYEWVWEMDMLEQAPSGICLKANETINVRKAPLVDGAAGAMTGKLKAGDAFKGQFYVGRQQGPCKLWVYGHGPGKLRGFACLHLPGQTLMQACH